jgi:aminoglycoside 3-N-acetyltransferase
LDYGYGPGSPLAKLVEAGGLVLLLGSPQANVTLLHLSEHVARLPNKQVIRYREKLLHDGRAAWVDIEEFDTANPVVEAAPEDHFEQLVRAYLERSDVPNGKVGSGESYLFDAQRLHRFAVDWLETRWGGEGQGPA